MDWTARLDGYCERLGPEYWAEPVNALTNLAFVLAALVMWPRARAVPLGRAMAATLAAIGVGSFLFHTHARAWAAAADVAPIALFILLYLYAALRRFWGLGPAASLAGTALFLPAAAALTPAISRLPFLGVSAAYWPVFLLIAGFAAALARRAPATARGLAVGAGALLASLVFRSLDETACDAVPVGTHFLWHLLNGAMLGWMIEVYRRHALAGAAAGR